MRIAFYGGSFNPVTVGHEAAVRILSERFDRVVVVPCGPRPDKRSTDTIDPVYRAAMCDLAFGEFANVEVDLSDLERAHFTPNDEIQEMLEARYPGAEIWHIVGADIVTGGATGNSYIHRVWTKGSRLWNEFNFGIFPRDGSPLNPNDLPPRSEILPATHSVSSSAVREALANGELELVRAFTSPAVFNFVMRHGLYQSWRGPARKNPVLIDLNTVFNIFFDKKNEKAAAMAKTLSESELRIDVENPDVVIVIGGDGTLLTAVRENWRRRRPIIGLNTGHAGFLLNQMTADDFLNRLREGLPTTAYHLPMLFAEGESPEGVKRAGFAFNDVWLERMTTQTAKIEVILERARQRHFELVCDGVLVCLSQGSAAYARAMGNQPVPPESELTFLAGSNVCWPAWWKGALSLSPTTNFEFEVLESAKRPVRLVVDGLDFGPVARASVRRSLVASAELLFAADYDWSEKILELFLPGT
ncbi:MAG: inorganic polyphosphate/ATP-NAD kinase [Candidatus Uhrbacteria bacterium GW2011_GWE2_45_35]|uniref:nicotinate-nucleotide adenylyltransferase n=1 Tax=Candidatus Uhrbacteria bacterium GW2011_GWE2_45_35 TaxID=1618993 RepID=A0A0G1MHB4_9BACT|nr:MAG: inorganic polyphosphate/ATP-NAD kinase [Candidatus Uhrbacteria bacterium GW2011_GWE2_45_35]